MANAGCSEVQISSFPKSTTLSAFTSLHWLTYPVVGLLCQFLEWRLLVNTGKLNSSVWKGHRTSPLLTFSRIVLTFCFLGLSVLPYFLTKKNGETCLLVATVVQMGLLRGIFHWIKLDASDSLGKEF